MGGEDKEVTLLSIQTPVFERGPTIEEQSILRTVNIKSKGTEC